MAAHPEPVGAAWAGAGAGGRTGPRQRRRQCLWPGALYSSGEVSVFVVLV